MHIADCPHVFFDKDQAMTGCLLRRLAVSL